MFWQSKANRCYEFRCARHKYSISYIFYQHQKTNHFLPQTMKVVFLFRTNIMVQCSSFYFTMQFLEQQKDIELSCLMPPNTQIHQKEICVLFFKMHWVEEIQFLLAMSTSAEKIFQPQSNNMVCSYQQITSFSSAKGYLTLTYKMRQ